jgi:hypothetical protein
MSLARSSRFDIYESTARTSPSSANLSRRRSRTGRWAASPACLDSLLDHALHSSIIAKSSQLVKRSLRKQGSDGLHSGRKKPGRIFLPVGRHPKLFLARLRPLDDRMGFRVEAYPSVCETQRMRANARILRETIHAIAKSAKLCAAG